MLPDYEEFRRRADAVRARIEQACGQARRDASGVELLAVTKFFPAEAVGYAARYGLRAVGENRVQEGAEKRKLARAAISWELIGHLQSNKARLAVGSFDRIQSVDSVKLLQVIDKGAAELGKTQAVLLQVNSGHDPAKSGVEPEEAEALLAAALAHKNVRVDGLMAIAPLSEDPEVARRAFAALRDTRERLRAVAGIPLPVLSMGMSGDLEAAVLEGSTLVRVGSALFGARS
jgi:hypothetical protein